MIQKGFYFHFKRDKNGDLGNYAYEVIGIGLDTEIGEESVVYRPLYKTDHELYIRPIKMFDELVTVNGLQIKRFELITEQNILGELIKLRDKMYL